MPESTLPAAAAEPTSEATAAEPVVGQPMSKAIVKLIDLQQDLLVQVLAEQSLEMRPPDVPELGETVPAIDEQFPAFPCCCWLAWVRYFPAVQAASSARGSIPSPAIGALP